MKFSILIAISTLVSSAFAAPSPLDAKTLELLKDLFQPVEIRTGIDPLQLKKRSVYDVKGGRMITLVARGKGKNAFDLGSVVFDKIDQNRPRPTIAPHFAPVPAAPVTPTPPSGPVAQPINVPFISPPQVGLPQAATTTPSLADGLVGAFRDPQAASATTKSLADELLGAFHGL